MQAVESFAKITNSEKRNENDYRSRLVRGNFGACRRDLLNDRQRRRPSLLPSRADKQPRTVFSDPELQPAPTMLGAPWSTPDAVSDSQLALGKGAMQRRGTRSPLTSLPLALALLEFVAIAAVGVTEAASV